MKESRTRAARQVALLTLLVAALSVVQLACVATPDPRPRNLKGAPESLRAGLDLYSAHEFARAGAQFHAAAEAAGAMGDRDLSHRATVAECTAWLRARRLQELGSCSARLADSQRRMRLTDTRVNALIAMGAIAAGRPVSSLRTVSAVRGVLLAAAEGK